jgi:hypothetical protein
MTTNREAGVIVFTCDHGKAKNCSGELDTAERDFAKARQALFEAKWRAYKDASNDWCHDCPACVELRKEAAFQTFSKRHGVDG